MRQWASITLVGGTGLIWPLAFIFIASTIPYPFLQRESVFPRRDIATISAPDIHPQREAPSSPPAKHDLSYLAYYAYSEVPPDVKPADTVLQTLKDIPLGLPLEEIKRASDAFGLDFTFMRVVARIESDFDPRQRTGSYIGLFQLSNYEFDKYGSGDIIDPRATMPLLRPTSSRQRPFCSNCEPKRSRPWTTFT